MKSPGTLSTPSSLRQTAKLWTLSVTLLLAILVIAWLFWAHLANVRLQTKIDSILAQHEPLYPTDFSQPPLPGDQNAAAFFLAAYTAKAPNIWSPSSSNMTYANYPPFPLGWHQLMDAALKANPRTLTLMRQARSCDRAQWIPHFSSPMINLWLPHLNESRELANFVGDAALDAHLHGDDAEAVERVRDLLHESDMLNDITLIERLVGLGIQAMALDRLTVISADNLQIEHAQFPPSPTTTSTITPVLRRVVIELINELLDEKKQRGFRRQTMLGERMVVFDSTLMLTSRVTILKPMFKLEAFRCLEEFDYDVRAADQPNSTASQAILAAAPFLPTTPRRSTTAPTAPEPPRFSRAVTETLLFNMNRYDITEWRLAAERRTAAAILAARLFHSDHNRWPKDLNELVPAYLPLVPKDPFSPTNSPIGYLLQPRPASGQPDRPLVYFDSPDHPTANAPPPYPSFGWQPSVSRQWRDLSLWIPPTPPATTSPAGSQ